MAGIPAISPTIATHPELLLKDIAADKTVICDQEGHWYCEDDSFFLVRWVMRVVRCIFSCLEDRRVANIAHVYKQTLQNLETKPIVTDAATGKIVDAVLHENHVKLGRELLRLKDKNVSTRVSTAVSELVRHVLAFQARTGALKPVVVRKEAYSKGHSAPEVARKEKVGKARDEGEVKMSALVIAASAWKADQIWASAHPDLSQRDQKLLTEAEQDPEVVKMLQDNPDEQERFFKWILRDHGTVGGFIGFPGLVDKIAKSHLQSRFGYFAGEGMEVQALTGKEGAERAFTLCFEGEDGKPVYVNAYDETQEVTLKLGYKVTIKKVFDTFKKKRCEWGDLEVCGGMICNWSAGELARKDRDGNLVPIDLDHKIWWSQLPPGKFITKAQALVIMEAPARAKAKAAKLARGQAIAFAQKAGEERRAGRVEEALKLEASAAERRKASDDLSAEAEKIKADAAASIKSGDAIVMIMGTRQMKSLGMAGTHAYDAIAMPTEDGRYEIQTIGMYSETFPRIIHEEPNPIKRVVYGVKEVVNMIAKTHRAKVVIPDGSHYIAGRQHGAKVCVVTQEVARQIWRNIAEDIQACRRNEEVYHIILRNCAMWTIRSLRGTPLEHELKDLFRVPFEASEPGGAAGTIFDFINKNFSADWRGWTFRKLFTLVGGDQSLVRKWRDADGKVQEEAIGLLHTLPHDMKNYMIPSAADIFDDPSLGLHGACCIHPASEHHEAQPRALLPPAEEDDRSVGERKRVAEALA